MATLRSAFDRLARDSRVALMPFIMGGHPRAKMTADLLLTLEDAGADVIEVGIPFSDPLADGPVIQAAATQALARGATPSGVLREIASVRNRLQTPVVLLTYWNPVRRFAGDDAARSIGSFLDAARASGCSGVIVPDLPVEENVPLRTASRSRGISTVLLAAPTSPPARLRRIAHASQGFVYYVSVTGTTGMRHALPPQLVQGVRRLRRMCRLPVCVGFGISTPAQARQVARVADGVIVGSALVQRISNAASAAACRRSAAAFVRQLRAAV
jgi:tryptophan synthase alpha chain